VVSELPEVSVVIPARNAARTIGDQLEALSRQEYPAAWEVIVADDHSRDATKRIASEWASRLPRLTLLSVGRGTGVNAARNAGFNAARGEVVLGCDADDMVAPGWVRVLSEALQYFDGVGGSLDQDAINPPAMMAQAFWTPPPWQLDANFLPRPIGANYGVRKSVWQRLGGFDESYRLGGTETEFFWRLQLAAYRLGFAPHAVVMYRRRATQRGQARQMYRFGFCYAHLYEKFAADGMPRLAAGRGYWRHTLSRAIRGRSFDRIAGRYSLAFLLGALAGSIRFRVRYL
jgi:glycosyltransferase involved in cell wall biosynthesis